MILSSTITTLKNTAIASPKHSVLKSSLGMITKMEVYFPPGSAGLAGIKIFDATSQLYPTTVGEWFIGDNVLISFVDYYKKLAAPWQFDIYSYNLDDEYDHVIMVRLGFASGMAEMALFLPQDQSALLAASLSQAMASESDKNKTIFAQAMAFIRRVGK